MDPLRICEHLKTVFEYTSVAIRLFLLGNGSVNERDYKAHDSKASGVNPVVLWTALSYTS